MRIYFDGCSWTKGAELENKEEERFSKLVADYFDAEECNIAMAGGSNDLIVRNMLVNHKIEEYDLVVIAMTFPARTEYHSDVPIASGRARINKPQSAVGWLPVNPKYNFSVVLNAMKQVGQDSIDALLERFQIISFQEWSVSQGIKVEHKNLFKSAFSQLKDHKKFWVDYYRTVTTPEFFEMKEKIQKQTIVNHCKVKGIPLVICTINPWTKEKFDLQLNRNSLPTHHFGHPTKEGHRIIADKIIRTAKFQKLYQEVFRYDAGK
jgi:hypothetical protein